ncbi:hypothetical protein DDF62_08440 [Caulobacter radicis]|uniref:hypothetical protein n=1 Tax=Caulobacter radicis TaxID=2172650 RepID=UPI000D584B1D|nr:hypothetical protein [Caulobacter radicis]PVM90829.1 hypothetical protein DDF62_08440 [Caulobacter radicis]
MNRRIVAEHLATRLFTAEEAVDNTLAAMGELIAAMPRARLQARVAAGVGQQAVDHVMEAASGLADVRRSLIAAHGALADAKDQIGLRRVTLVGGGDKAEDGDPTRTGFLEVVKSA